MRKPTDQYFAIFALEHKTQKESQACCIHCSVRQVASESKVPVLSRSCSFVWSLIHKTAPRSLPSAQSPANFHEAVCWLSPQGASESFQVMPESCPRPLKNQGTKQKACKLLLSLWAFDSTERHFARDLEKFSLMHC